MISLMKRDIRLPNGSNLELEASEAFYDKVRQHFELPHGIMPSDDHVRMFIYGACKNAFDKAEEEMSDGRSWEDRGDVS
jgi:hypothetical protein